MNVLLALIPVTLMLIALTLMAVSHVHVSLDIQGMEHCVKVNIFLMCEGIFCIYKHF